MADQWKNKLYFGDNLDVLRRYIPDESVDLIYLDPPFNSKATYNVLFKERNGTAPAAQIRAFDDFWHWDRSAEKTFREVVEAGGKIGDLLAALRRFLGANDMMAYITMMAIRLKELHRVLKPTGSLYLHCDPTASHYLKLVLDAVFGPQNFRNEIVWKRTHFHGSSRRCGPVHDTILFYTASRHFTWTYPTMPQDPEYIERHFRHTEPGTGRRFQAISLTGPGVSHGDSGKPWRGVDPTAVGRHWALPTRLLEELGVTGGTTQDKLDALHQAGLIYWPAGRGRTPRLKLYADGLGGVALPDVWTDIPPVAAHARERLGYATQKPEALLERIIRASSNEGDLVLDPFCGCGTTVVVAERLHRRWIGIDITHLAVALMKRRLEDTFGRELSPYEVIGEPVDLASARALAQQDRFQFQCWALGLVGARPARDPKRGADKGVDGVITFFDDDSGEAKRAIVQVKSGHVGAPVIRDLKGTMEREGAQVGVLITLEPPTAAMRTEALDAGFYQPEGTLAEPVPRVQILTVQGLLDGSEGLDLPPARHETFEKAPRRTKAPKRRS